MLEDEPRLESTGCTAASIERLAGDGPRHMARQRGQGAGRRSSWSATELGRVHVCVWPAGPMQPQPRKLQLDEHVVRTPFSNAT